MTHHGGAPPGWYDDATGPGMQRWWDGRRWTDHRRGPQPPVHYSGAAPYPQPFWPAPPARRRTSRALWITPLAIGGVLLVGYAVFFAATRNSHNEWYQKGYDVGQSAWLFPYSTAKTTCTVATWHVGESDDPDRSSHMRDAERGCRDAVEKRIDEKNASSSP